MQKISVVIDRFEGEKAVLKLEDGQTLIVPIEFLPEEASEGDVLRLSFGNDREEKEKKENLAKSLLNEMLKKE